MGRPARDERLEATGRAAHAFAAHLARVRPEIERRLRARWDAKLEDVRRHGPDVVAMVGAARDLTLRGGKRFRAAMLAAAFLGVAPRARLEPALEAGTAIELLQAYLLMQDDWIDGDARRRGGPSVHAALARALGGAELGAASAILASDLTWGLSLDTLASAAAPPARLLEVIRLFAAVHDDVVIGQELDVLGGSSRSRSARSRSARSVEAMHALKTGSYTVRGPLLLGATLAGAPRRTLAALERYAAPLGVAFQLRDDLLGAFGSPAETGKPEGGDLRAGKRTAVIAAAERRLDAAGRAALARVMGKPRAPIGAVRAAARALDGGGARAPGAPRRDQICSPPPAQATPHTHPPPPRAILAGAAGALRMPGGSG